MVRNALYHIAGVDRATIETCPATDRLWAGQLGLSLLLSFTVVLGVSFHATGYMIPNLYLRSAAALVIACTVFMFDRALYQSDWFHQGLLWRSRSNADDGASPPRRFLRISVRLVMSFGLAWVIAVFLELAIFSDSITDKLKRDHLTVNEPIYQKIGAFEAQLNTAIEQKRSTLSSLEALLRSDLDTAPPAEKGEPPAGGLEQQIKSLDQQEAELRAGLRQTQDTIKSYAADMNAEELGQRLNAGNSGRMGAGPRYQFAKRQKEVYEEQRVAQENEIALLRARREELRATQTRIAADEGARRNQLRDAAESKRQALQAQIASSHADLMQLEATRLSSVEEFRAKALAASDFQKQRDDPLARMTAFQELKNDPKDGATISLLSWMTKFLVIFLEIVPIVAKLFFSPPSVYAAKVQAEVERERRRVLREREQALRAEAAVELQEHIAWASPRLSQGDQPDGPLMPPEPPGSPVSDGRTLAMQPEYLAELSSITPERRTGEASTEEASSALEAEERTRHELNNIIEQGRSKRDKGQDPDGQSAPVAKQRLLRPLVSLDLPRQRARQKL